MGSRAESSTSTQAALEAMRRGYQPVPIRDGGKKPHGSGWPHHVWESEEQVITSFEKWSQEGASGVGIALGKVSGGLVDVDLDNRHAIRFKDYFLPQTAMRHGRPSNRHSHFWYRVKDISDLPGTRRYTMPDRSVSVELRSTGGQTVIPPTTWHPKEGDKRPPEQYFWEGEPFGGDEGPAEVDGRVLAVQVALVGLGAVLADSWPASGGRHDAYLALAGGVLRYGDGVHPWWEKNLPVLISALADVTHDDDGPEERVKEVMGTTVKALREGRKAVGFPRLSELIGVDAAEAARRMVREVESRAGFMPDDPQTLTSNDLLRDDEELPSTLPPRSRNPLEERRTSWDAVDLEPYLLGDIKMPEPTILTRSDGHGLFYPGRVNMLYGLSESAKSWISLMACVQEMGKGERVVYFDLEDEPTATVHRLRLLGAADEEIQKQFVYIHPETPISPMQRSKFGSTATESGEESFAVLREVLNTADPTLIVADGMTVLYGLHGLDTNDAMSTDIITNWLKSLTRSGRTAVIVIDHTGKSGGKGASPIGAHHKIAMIQGTALRADAVTRPMEGREGLVNLVVYKDRPGGVRRISSNHQEQIAAKVTMDSTQPDMTRFKIEPPDDQDVVIGAGEQEAELERLARAEKLSERVLALYGGEVGACLTTAEVMRQTKEAGEPIERDDLYAVWMRLEHLKIVRREGANRWTKFRLLDPSEPEKGQESVDEEED